MDGGREGVREGVREGREGGRGGMFGSPIFRTTHQDAARPDRASLGLFRNDSTRQLETAQHDSA
jgi:hypothetical protein